MKEQRNHQGGDGALVLGDAQGDADENGVEDDARLKCVGPDQVFHALQGPVFLHVCIDFHGFFKTMQLDVHRCIFRAGPLLIKTLVELLVQEPLQCECEQTGSSCKGHCPA